MSKRRKLIAATSDIGKKRQLEIAQQKDMDELSKMPSTPEERKLMDDFADGKDIVVARGEWLARFLRCYRATIDLFKRIQAEAGYAYKDIDSVDLADYKNCPVWIGGRLEIGYNNEPESLAHELGHGLHEKIRGTGMSDFLGEEFAQAIRFYVESGMGTNSPWLGQFDKGKNPFTSRYTLDQFVGALKSGDLFQAVCWE